MKDGRKAEPEKNLTGVHKSSDRTGRMKAARSPDFEKIRIEREEQPQNPYYLRVSKGYKAAKFTALALFVGYLIVMLCMYRSSITYDNLMYLIRDFETDVDVSSKGFDEITYSESEKMNFGLYKDRLALATGTDFTLYNTTGAVELEYDHSMENPKIESGEKYALVYDIGGTSYSVYNTIARVSTKRLDYAIQGAHMSDSGAFALITRSKENRYLVSFYDSSFRELTRVYKDKYVTDVAVSKDGKNYVVASCNVENSDFKTEIMVGRINSDTCSTVEKSGYLPLSVDWFDNGDFVLVCDGAAIFCDSEGNTNAVYPFGDMRITSAYVCKDRLLLTGSENIVGSTSKAVMLDSKGSVEDQFVYDGKISSGVLSENYMFFLAGEKILRRDFSGNETFVSCPAYVKAIVPYFDNIAVCTGTNVTMGFDVSGTGDEEKAEETQADEETKNTESGIEGEDTLDVEMDLLG